MAAKTKEKTKNKKTDLKLPLLSEEAKLLIEHGDTTVNNKFSFVLQILQTAVSFILGAIAAETIAVMSEPNNPNTNLLITSSIILFIVLIPILYLIWERSNNLAEYYKLRFKIINLATNKKERQGERAKEKLREFLSK